MQENQIYASTLNHGALERLEDVLTSSQPTYLKRKVMVMESDSPPRTPSPSPPQKKERKAVQISFLQLAHPTNHC